MARRNERAQERHILELAKEEHRKIYGEDTELNRVKLRKLKKQVKMKIQVGQLKKKHNIVWEWGENNLVKKMSQLDCQMDVLI